MPRALGVLRTSADGAMLPGASVTSTRSARAPVVPERTLELQNRGPGLGADRERAVAPGEGRTEEGEKSDRRETAEHVWDSFHCCGSKNCAAQEVPSVNSGATNPIGVT